MRSRHGADKHRHCCSFDSHVVLCVDIRGACARWTSGLMQRVLHRGSVVMRVDGPYGEFQDHPEWTHYRTLVIVAGGIGASLLCCRLHLKQIFQIPLHSSAQKPQQTALVLGSKNTESTPQIIFTPRDGVYVGVRCA